MEGRNPLEVAALRAGVRLERAGKRHARELARIMREDDKIEVKASGGLDPEKAVRASINRSAEAWAVYTTDASNKLLVVFGVAVFDSGWQAPWALSSIHAPKHPVTYWRASKAIVPLLRDRYPKMVQMIHARYTPALRWAERLGFRVEPPVRFGAENTLFCRVSMETPRLITRSA